MRPGGLSASRAKALALGRSEGVGEGLGNGVVFVWAFLEMMGWFWVGLSTLDDAVLDTQGSVFLCVASGANLRRSSSH